MLPTVEQIVCYRYIAVAVLRVVGAFLLLMSVVPIGSWLAEGLVDGDLFWLGYYLARILTGCAFGFLGFLFLLLAGPIVKLLLPFPAPRCPRCSYSLRNYSRTYCPECGLVLPRSLVESIEAGDQPQPAAPPRIPRPDAEPRVMNS